MSITAKMINVDMHLELGIQLGLGFRIGIVLWSGLGFLGYLISIILNYFLHGTLQSYVKRQGT